MLGGGAERRVLGGGSVDRKLVRGRAPVSRDLANVERCWGQEVWPIAAEDLYGRRDAGGAAHFLQEVCVPAAGLVCVLVNDRDLAQPAGVRVVFGKAEGGQRMPLEGLWDLGG